MDELIVGKESLKKLSTPLGAFGAGIFSLVSRYGWAMILISFIILLFLFRYAQPMGLGLDKNGDPSWEYSSILAAVTSVVLTMSIVSIIYPLTLYPKQISWFFGMIVIMTTILLVSYLLYKTTYLCNQCKTSPAAPASS